MFIFKNNAVSKKILASTAAFSLLTISLLSLSACTNYNSGKTSITNASVLNSNPKKGGTLTIFTSNTNMNFDPARSQGCLLYTSPSPRDRG